MSEIIHESWRAAVIGGDDARASCARHGLFRAAIARTVLIAWLVTIAAGPATAQSNEEAQGFWGRVRTSMPSGFSASGSSTDDGFLRQTANGIKELWSGGHDDVFVPGYIWHLPWQYSSDQRARYNTSAWGAGFGRTVVDGSGHPRTLLALVSADSYSRPQYMAAYTWRARWRPRNGALSLGGGYTALLIGRADILHYTPLPLALPLASIGTDRFEILGTYVPGFEVGYFFARVRVR
jgi:palmitoyl transferase